MSTLADFYAKAKTDSVLRADLEAARKGLGPNPSREAVTATAIQVAGKHGFPLSQADFERKSGSLDDQELKAVAGGCSPCPHTEITVIW